MSFSIAYTEYRPPADIAPWIACFWQIIGECPAGGSLLHRVLPDGCADLVFDLEDARQSGNTPANIIGPMSSANVLELRNAIEIFGWRLRPGATAAFSGLPAGYLLDSSFPLLDLPQPLRISSEKLAECAKLQGRLQLLADTCRKRLASHDKPDPVVGYALAKWSHAETSSLPTVSVLTRDIGLSERALNADVGLTPVQYRRL